MNLICHTINGGCIGSGDEQYAHGFGIILLVMLAKINLVNFRNYEKAEFEFSLVTVVVGENGAGKSNLVEAIYLLATGKSFRAERDNEMVSYGQSFSKVSGQIEGEKLEVVLNDRKKLEVNGVAKRQVDFVGRLPAVCFSPQDMELVTGSPGGRRRYLDFVISQMDREYRRCLVSYEKGLRQRNKLLEMIREDLAGRNQLFFWDRLLIKDGEYITRKRQEYLDRNENAFYDKSVISEARLKQYEVEEVAAAVTLVGPHRDDFVINLKGRDVSKFGSRGEQRMAVFGLKEKEIEYLGGSPLLLLDDIFSELDHKHREEVMNLVEDYGGQVIITTTEPNLLPGFREAKTITL